jgi:hypothetical protein
MALKDHEPSLKPSAMAEQLRQQAISMKQFITAAREDYCLTAEEKERKAKNRIRAFQQGDWVLKLVRGVNKKDKKVGESFQGPYEVIEAGSSGVDYRIKRIGAQKQAEHVHVDDLRAFHRDDEKLQEAAELEAAHKSAKVWDVHKIVGEKGRTRRTKQYRVMWHPEDAKFTTWEPADNLGAPLKIQEWMKLTSMEQAQLTEQSDQQLYAAAALSLSVPSDDDAGEAILSVSGTGTSKPSGLIKELGGEHRGMMIKTICDQLGIERDQVRCVVASPPCETFSPADASNISRGNNYRDHSDPDKPPRGVKSCHDPEDVIKRNKAVRHDQLVKNLVQSAIADRKRGYDYELVIENPVGSLRQRPFMRGEAVESLLERRQVDYCAYGKPYRKPTDFWSSFAWTPQGQTGNGVCNSGLCQQGVINKHGQFRHTRSIGGPNSLKPKGLHIMKQLWSIPDGVMREILCGLDQPHSAVHSKRNVDKEARVESNSVSQSQIAESSQQHVAAKSRVESEQVNQSQVSDHSRESEPMYIIDLFSGGQSWRPIVEQAGYTYLPVDMNDHSRWWQVPA